MGEPLTFQEGQTIWSWVKEKRNSADNFYLWINYLDIEGSYKVVEVGDNWPVFVKTTYMGSLSTLGKLPKEWWQKKDKEGTLRRSDITAQHGAMTRIAKAWVIYGVPTVVS